MINMEIVVGGIIVYKIYLYYAKRYENFSLTCRKCGSLATPIAGTNNRYRCPNGKKQFAEVHHGF